MTQEKFSYISPDGQTYHFWNMITDHSNLGIPPVKFIEDSGPQQHGVNVRDWRINPRTITLQFFKETDGLHQSRTEILHKIINKIRGNRGRSLNVPGWLRYVNDNWEMLEIPVFVLQGPRGDYNHTEGLLNNSASDSIQFYANDPIWREVRKRTILVNGTTRLIGTFCIDSTIVESWNLDEGINLDEGSLLDDFGFTTVSSTCIPGCLSSQSYVLERIPVQYTGTWDGDQIDILLRGPMTQPTITNETLGRKIELNYIIEDEDYVIITIRPEFATVVNAAGDNLIATLSSISDLADFVFKCEGEVTPTGENIITVAAAEPDWDKTEIQIDYYVRHISAFGG